MTVPSPEDYPATWGGVLLCCTYTGIITGRFMSDALLQPVLRALLTCCAAFASTVRAYPDLFVLPLVVIWKVLAAGRRWWRGLNWRRQMPYILGSVIYGTYCALSWLVSWVHCCPWWCAPCVATFLPLAIPSAATVTRLKRLILRVLFTLSDVCCMPVLLPFIRRPIPKKWIWWPHVQLGRFYRASLSRQLLQCFACYLLLLLISSSGVANTLPVMLTNFHEVVLSVTMLSTSRPARVHHHAEDVHVARCTMSSTKRFVPDVQRGKVTAVYDGDTLTVAARHGRQGLPYLFRVRLAGVDAPEIRGATSADEKRAAIAARDALRAAILGELVTLTVYGLDKYGRLLASVAHDRTGDVSRRLLEAGYVRPYDGGKRGEWTRQTDKISLRN